MKSRFFQVSVKIILAIFILVQLGLPILDLWKMLLLLGSWLALACCDLRLNKRCIFLSIAVVIFVITIKNFLPNASINEGHNIFLYTGDGGALQQGLPSEIFKEWRQAFEKQYPPEQHPDAPWRQTPPTTLYANSSDALWRTARYSRQVNTISFKNLSEFRGGFAGDKRYNFYSNDPISLARNFQVQLPFFVMYEFSKQSVGCTLHWHGTVYWQKDAESFEKIVSQNDSERIITAEDIGKRVYALNLPAVFAGYKEWSQSRKSARTPPLYELAMHLDLSPKLEASRVAGNLLSFLGVLVLICLMIRINWKSYLIAISLTALSLIIIGVFIHYSNGKFLGPEYPTHGGGDDGLLHESYGRDIARMAMSGDLKESFKGLEEVYWFTPGMRYFRAVEKILFGDTNLGYTALVALLAWFVYLFIRHFSGFKWGMVGSILFLILPLGSLSFWQYIQNAKLGYAEAAAFGFFMLGFYLFIRSNPRWGGQKDGLFAFTGGMCLAGSMFLRPNFAIAVSLLGSFYIFTCWRAKSFKTMIAAMVGLALALWMPLHNYIYGHQFVLISSSGTTVSITLNPLTYLHAGYEFLSGNWNGQHINEVVKQLSGWLWTLPRLAPYPYLKFMAELFMAMKLVTLSVTVFIAFRSIFLKQKTVFVLAWTALAAHIPMLFVFASGQFRYAMLAWDLSAILTLIIVAARIQKPPAHLNHSLIH